MLSAELAGIARHGIDATARTAIETLSVRTWSDAIEVYANLARTGFDQWANGLAKMSELGIKLAIESSAPLIGRSDHIWNRAYPRP